MEGKRRKNKVKEQRHQANYQPLYESFKESGPGGKAAAGGGVGSGSGTRRAQLNACLRGGEHAGDISRPRGGEGKGIFGGEGGAMPWRQGYQRKLGWKLHFITSPGADALT